MSSYNGYNLFNSGAHTIYVDGLMVAKKRTGYAGCNGLETLTMGSRGRPVIIAGFLRGASRAVVSALILAIEEQIRDVDYATLIDGDSNSYNYVALDSFVQRGPYKYTADGAVLCQYEVRGRQLV